MDQSYGRGGHPGGGGYGMGQQRQQDDYYSGGQQSYRDGYNDGGRDGGGGGPQGYGPQEGRGGYGGGEGPGGYSGGPGVGHGPGGRGGNDGYYDQRHQQQRGSPRDYDDGSGPRGGGPISPDPRSPQPQLPKINEQNVAQCMERINRRCLKRGICGYKEFRRMFKLYNWSNRRIDAEHGAGSRDRMQGHGDELTAQELFEGLQKYGCTDISLSDCKELIRYYSRNDRPGVTPTLSLNEFMRAMRPQMSASRQKLVDLAFRKMDKTGDGVIDFKDIQRAYKPQEHPKFKSGEWTAKQVFTEFLNSFEPDDEKKDGIVTKEEWEDYYSGVSCSIDKDVYFDYMMRQAYNI